MNASGALSAVGYLVACHRYGFGALGAPLHLDEAQAVAAVLARFDVVAEAFGAHIQGFVTKRPLGVHDRRHRKTLDFGPPLGGGLAQRRRAIGLGRAQKPVGHDQRPAPDLRREGADLTLPGQRRKPPIEAVVEIVRPALGPVRPKAGSACRPAPAFSEPPHGGPSS